jgi:hypothetical protein
MLVVYDLEDAGALAAARDEILARRPSPGALEVEVAPPFHAAAAATGRWLLVAGFPAEKPPSAEMERARRRFLDAWSGLDAVKEKARAIAERRHRLSMPSDVPEMQRLMRSRPRADWPRSCGPG